MKFGFIAGKAQQSFEALSERAAKRGHVVEHVPLRDMTLSEEGVVRFVQECSVQFDALHYYAGLADPIGIFFGQICDEYNVPLLNNRAHIPQLTHDKMFQTLSFVRAGLPIPKTEFTRNPDWSVLSEKLGDPVIAKRVRGTQGKHVHKITSQSDLDEKIDTPSSFLFQEYIPHANDVRVLVLKGKAICGYQRVPVEDDFRANLARGGVARPLASESEKEETFALAEAAVAAMPHDLAGVDVIKSERDQKYRLIEVNVNPSWYRIKDIVNMSFEDVLLDEYERLAKLR